ncbi:beta-1,4-galactosyltransferase 7 [Diachasma alloeum]|uniref:beta-1,4-galactosyltransferase 7 n=1 Tax=Diachasma alloeum TaxID=454923 RepID=UPI000738318C|nr:beta-1,4-galactosyltransferase 7 [Diachasma alloeum]XP_015111173.1 beta-1,4-galactosyltransferase 7 [Diachasma alloeum]
MESRWKGIRPKYLLVGILITFFITCLISTLPFSTEECKCPGDSEGLQKDSNNVPKPLRKSQHRLAVLVPFRDRFEELLTFAPYMKRFLDKQNIDYRIFILHQVDRFRFNRASLVNVGFLHVKNEFDYIAMHDVDLLPLNDNLSYGYPDTPFHVSAPDLHPRYHYSTFIGGILLIKRDHFIQVNGMSNKYWGWGLEDDEFYVRLKEANLVVRRPQNISTGTQNTFRHIHDKNHRKRDTTKCFNQREVTRKRDRETGLDNVSYKILEVINITISDSQLTILNIELSCDKTLTPWCECIKTNEIKDKKIVGENKKTAL